MRALIIDKKAQEKIARVLAHAEKNHYYPAPGKSAPGDDLRFVAQLGTFRAVFSYTHADGLIYRHLSVSVPGGKYPGPEAVNMIAKLFGFTPDINKWMRHINQEDRCIVVVEPLGSDLTSVKLS